MSSDVQKKLGEGWNWGKDGEITGGAVVDGESDGKFDDDVGVIGFRWSKGRHIDVEMFFAFTTVVSGVP